MHEQRMKLQMQIESVKSASNFLLLLLLVALIAVFVTLHLIHDHQRLAAAANLSFHFPALCSLLPHTYQTRLPAGKGHRTASLMMASPQETDETPFFLSALKTHGPKPYNSDLSGC
jgi:hypothetical protein